MTLRRVVSVLYVPIMEDDTVDLPDNAVIVAVEFQDVGGLGSERRASGVWIEVASNRYDSAYDRSFYRDELPPPKGT